jgi:hypothetical protein
LEAEREDFEVSQAVSFLDTPQKSEKKMDRFASRAQEIVREGKVKKTIRMKN